MTHIFRQLREMSAEPSGEESFAVWLEQADIIPFLSANARQDEFVVYASFVHVFIHAVFVPASAVDSPDAKDLVEWSCGPDGSWAISCAFRPPSVFVSPPLDHTSSSVLDGGEQIVFARSFEGRVGDKRYFEVLQKFVQVFGLHFLPERNAYCRLDERGDIEDVIRIIGHKSGDSREVAGTVITCRRDVLDDWMLLTDAVLVRTFDFTRFRLSAFGGWNTTPGMESAAGGEIVYKRGLESGHGSYSRGSQIVRPYSGPQKLDSRVS